MIASDGLFDKMTNQNCIDLIKNQINKLPHGAKDMHKVASIVAAKSIKRDKSKDNVTLIVISLN
jgi:serine/threonine protein phosphatase PrpC